MPKRHRLRNSLLIATLLALGAGIAWGAFVTWNVVWLASTVLSGRGVIEQTVFGVDGTPVIQSYSAINYQDRTYRTLDNQPFTPPRDESFLALVNLPVPRPDSPEVSNGWYYRVMGASDGSRPPVFWYFVNTGGQDGQGYFVGYESRSKLVVGYLGRQGFRPGMPPREEWFPIDCRIIPTTISGNLTNGTEPYDASAPPAIGRFPQWMVYFISGNELVEIDLTQRKVRVLFESPEMLSIGRFERALNAEEANDAERRMRLPEFLALRTADAVIIFDSTGKQVQRLTIPTELRGEGFQLTELATGEPLAYLQHDSPDLPRSENRIVHFDEAGKVLSEQEYKMSSGANPRAERWQQAMIAIAVPSPGVLSLLDLWLSPKMRLVNGLDPTFGAALRHSLQSSGMWLVASYVLAAWLAWQTYRRELRYAQPHAWAWVAFVWLGGVPGWFGYWCHRHWPAREACPACQTTVPRDRPSCAACQVPFPRPLLKGIEVFG